MVFLYFQAMKEGVRKFEEKEAKLKVKLEEYAEQEQFVKDMKEIQAKNQS